MRTLKAMTDGGALSMSGGAFSIGSVSGSDVLVDKDIERGSSWGRMFEAVRVFVTAPFKKAKEANDDFFRLAGAWESDKSADDMVAEIKAARHFKKEEEIF
jgi:hypothetical protein